MVRTKDPQKIPRPLNSFFLFRLATIAEWRLQRLERQPDLSKKISEMWDALSREKKAIYINMAKEAKEVHQKMYPDYQYRPKRNKKTTIVKIEDASSPSPSTSTSRSSSLASSSPSTPAPATPDTTTAMLPVGLSPTAFDFSSTFGEGFVLNHPVPPGVHANMSTPPSYFSYHADRVLTDQQLPHSVQPNGHPWSPQVAGWTEPPPLPSTSTTGLHWQSAASSLLHKGAETAQGLFPNPYAYQPHASYAPQQAFPPPETVQFLYGVMNTQPPQPSPQKAVNQVLPSSQAHTSAPQPQTEPLFSGVARSSELEAWEKEFAPLDAGFCDFLSAWNNVQASSPAASAASSPTPPLTSGVTSTSASESLPPAAAYNLDVPADNHAQELPSQTEDPLAFPSASDFFDSDPSFMSPFDPLYGQLYDPFEDLPPSAVWPEALNSFGI